MLSPFRIGTRVYYRPLELADAALLVRWMNNIEVTQYLVSGVWPFNEGKERAWIEKMYTSGTDVVLLACLREPIGDLPADTPVGMSGIHQIDPVHRFCTLGIVVGETSMQGRGLGREMMRLLLDHAFDDVNVERVELSVYDFNTRAHALYIKLGFVEEGRLVKRRWKGGAWRDEILMVMRREAWTARRSRGESG